MRTALAALVVALMGSAALAQEAPNTPSDPAEMAKRIAEMRAADAKRPDNPGTGPFAAVKQVDPGLPAHVVYRPADLSRLGAKKLGVLVWGNGGCSDDAASARFHLLEIASHGWLVIAPGEILSGPGAPPPVPAPPRAPGSAGTPGMLPPIKTTWQQVMEGVDWALAENDRAGSPYQGRIDPAQVAIAGHSCGGLQAIQGGADPRIHAVIVQNSGIFTDGSNPISGVKVDKTMLLGLHTPVLYILGGKTDVAWPNGTDDFARISHVPAALVTADVGHGGTFREENGGDAAQILVDWLAWQLRADPVAEKRFVGADCGLCGDPKWTIERKGF